MVLLWAFLRASKSSLGADRRLNAWLTVQHHPESSQQLYDSNWRGETWLVKRFQGAKPRLIHRRSWVSDLNMVDVLYWAGKLWVKKAESKVRSTRFDSLEKENLVYYTYLLFIKLYRGIYSIRSWVVHQRSSTHRENRQQCCSSHKYGCFSSSNPASTESPEDPWRDTGIDSTLEIWRG